MITITFVTPRGETRQVETEPAGSLMEAALAQGVPGILAECGGTCACGTCHVYVDDAWLAATGEPGDGEADMLSFSASARPNSRLACQIELTPAHDRLVVTLPESQG